MWWTLLRHVCGSPFRCSLKLWVWDRKPAYGLVRNICCSGSVHLQKMWLYGDDKFRVDVSRQVLYRRLPHQSTTQCTHILHSYSELYQYYSIWRSLKSTERPPKCPTYVFLGRWMKGNQFWYSVHTRHPSSSSNYRRGDLIFQNPNYHIAFAGGNPLELTNVLASSFFFMSFFSMVFTKKRYVNRVPVMVASTRKA